MIPKYNCGIFQNFNWKQEVSVSDLIICNFPLKMKSSTITGRALQVRANFGGEDNLGWETTLDGRQPLMEDNIQWKMTFYGRQLCREDSL